MKTEEYEEFYCDCCKTFTKILKTTLKKRKYEKNKKFCVECYSKIVPKHGPKKIDFYPEEIRDIINLDVLPYERVMEVKDVLKTKKKVSFKCKICESESVISFVNMKTRKYAKFEPICQKCILKYVYF
jgi:transposase-like protein